MENEPKPNDTPPAAPVVLVAVGFLVGAVVVGACWLSSRTTESERHAIVRNVSVDYLYETAPSSTSGNNDLAVDTIEFLPSYVVLTDTRGRTQLLALNRLRKSATGPPKSSRGRTTNYHLASA